MSRPGFLRKLVIAASPHVRGPASTPVIMWNVAGSLVPLIIAATYFFGPSALLVVIASVLGAVATEHFLGKGSTISDGSAAITGIVLGLTLPPGAPTPRHREEDTEPRRSHPARGVGDEAGGRCRR